MVETTEAFVEGCNLETTSAYAIKAEIADWSQQVLEVACDAYSGLPPCPFARGAWIDGKVSVEVTDSIDEVLCAADEFMPDDEMVLVYALLDSGGLTVEQFNDCLADFNAMHRGVWLMGSHHEAPDDELMPEFEASTGVDYGLILVQSLEHLVVASDKLRDSGYYDAYEDADMEYIDLRKEQYNAWNEEG